MKCQTCGEAVAPDARQCWHCGAYTAASKEAQFEHYALIALVLVAIGTAASAALWLAH